MGRGDLDPWRVILHHLFGIESREISKIFNLADHERLCAGILDGCAKVPVGSVVARIQTLDVSAYSEADVRAEVIDPIIRALGYQKETYFSLARKKHLKVLDKDLFIDYSMTLWSQNFWLIEAKKVQRKRMAFSHNDLNQALQYATHPEINAALVVLCDGRIIDVYDREVSVVDRVLRVEVARLSEEFDKLRALLAPWQLWFFEKRRVIRSLDKVFDQEINMSRLEEFRQLVSPPSTCALPGAPKKTASTSLAVFRNDASTRGLSWAPSRLRSP